jgi:prevent-host-death family protein
MRKAARQDSADTVGVRDLKANLSKHLRQVRKGASLTVTDRGQPVARIIPTGISPGMERLIRDGVVSWNGRKPVLLPPIKLSGKGPSLSDTVIRMRDEREEVLHRAIGGKSRRRK